MQHWIYSKKKKKGFVVSFLSSSSIIYLPSAAEQNLK